MSKIPENREAIKELLCEQLQLLAEKSKTADVSKLIALSEAMNKIAETLGRYYSSLGRRD